MTRPLFHETVVIIEGDEGFQDEFDEYLEKALQDPRFAEAFDRYQAWYESAYPFPVCIDGREYHRRRKARRRRARKKG